MQELQALKEQEICSKSKNDDNSSNGGKETDGDETDDKDYGMSPVTGVWAASQKLRAKSEPNVVKPWRRRMTIHQSRNCGLSGK
jgi:hypothetical protein